MRRKPHLDALLSELVTQTTPDLLAFYGMGIGRRLAGHRRGQPGPASEAAWGHLCGTAPIPALLGAR
jgi:hypothetical protein